MASFNPLDVLLQKVFVLATGTAASESDLNFLQTTLGPQQNDFLALKKLIDSHMISQARSLGTNALLKKVVLQGTGQDLSVKDVADQAYSLLGKNQDDWSNLFTYYVMGKDDPSTVLTYRAEAAQFLLDKLKGMSKSSLLNLSSVKEMTENYLQSISLSNGKYQTAEKGLDLFAQDIKTSGMTIKVADGYLVGATVFIDNNHNRVRDSSEWSSATNSFGEITLPLTGLINNQKIVVSGGLDIMTGQPFKAVLSAPIGSTIVTPLTTLVDMVLAAKNDDNLANAIDKVKSALGISHAIDLLSYDPVTILGKGTDPKLEQEQAFSIYAKTVQVMNLVLQTTAVIGFGVSDRTTSVFKALSDILLNQNANLTDIGFITQVIQKSAGEIGTALSAAKANALAQIVADVNARVSSASDLSTLAKIIVTGYTSIPNALLGSDPTVIKDAYTGSNLTKLINASTPQNILPNTPVDSVNGVDTQSPILQSAEVASDGKSIILYYNESLASKTVGKEAFSVAVGSLINTIKPTKVDISGYTVQVSVDTTIKASEPVWISYKAPSIDSSATNSAIQDLVGNDAFSVSSLKAENKSQYLIGGGRDTTSPVFDGKPITNGDGSKIYLKFDEILAKRTALISNFSVVDSDTNKSVDVLSVMVNNNTVELLLGAQLKSGTNVTISYTPDSDDRDVKDAIQDLSGNLSNSFTKIPVTIIDMTPPAPAKPDVTINGQTIRINFDKDVNKAINFNDLARGIYFEIDKVNFYLKDEEIKNNIKVVGKGLEIDFSDSHKMIGKLVSTTDKIKVTIPDKIVESATGIKNTGFQTTEFLFATVSTSITGTDGSDTLIGNADKNSIKGGNGNDIINGKQEADTLEGGAGNDTFVFDYLPSSSDPDTIIDFTPGQDVINISKAAFDQLTALGPLSSNEFLSGAGKNAAETAGHRLIYNTTNGNLYYDADGTGAGTVTLIGIFSNKPTLSISDFVIIA